MKYCNYCDVTSVYSLNSRKLPGHFSYGLGMRLVVHKLNQSNWQRCGSVNDQSWIPYLTQAKVLACSSCY